MVMDVKCAFLCVVCRRRIYIELLRQDPKHGAADLGKGGPESHGGVGFCNQHVPAVRILPFIKGSHRCCARGRLLVLGRDEGVGVALRQLGAEVRTEEVTDYILSKRSSTWVGRSGGRTMTTERATLRLMGMSDIPSCCCRSGLCNNARMWTRR